jgi:DNA-binding MarR family transcriptional regulator
MAAYYSAKEYQVKRSIGHLGRALGTRVTTNVAALFEEREITFVQYVILMHLRDGIASTCAELAQAVRYDSGALTRVIDQLEERKLLRRVRSKSDRRCVHLHITALGKRTAEAILPSVVALYNDWMSPFTKQEADTLVGLLARLNAHISGQNAGKN